MATAAGPSVRLWAIPRNSRLAKRFIAVPDVRTSPAWSSAAAGVSAAEERRRASLSTLPTCMTVHDSMPRPPLVLLANDQEWAARSLESILGPHGYAVLRAYTGQQAIELARGARPDLVILDARLPDMSGVEVCATLRSDPRFSAATPVVVTTAGPAERSQRIAALQAGAWEFYSQPLDGEVLLLKLDTYARAKREYDRVREEGLLDSTTGLYNMRGLARRARELGADAQRRHAALACVAVAPRLEEALPADDPRTEALAARLGAALRRTGRASDAIGRFGQSEFAIVAPSTEAAGALRMVERLRESVEALPLAAEGGEPLQLQAGYYAVPNYAESGVDPVELLLRATTALRQAASGPAGGIAAFGPDTVTSA